MRQYFLPFFLQENMKKFKINVFSYLQCRVVHGYHIRGLEDFTLKMETADSSETISVWQSRSRHLPEWDLGIQNQVK